MNRPRRHDIRTALKATREGFPLLKRLADDIAEIESRAHKYAGGKLNPVWQEEMAWPMMLYTEHKKVCDACIKRVDEACEPWFKL